MGTKKYKETIIKEENGLYPLSPPLHDDFAIDLTIPTPPQSPAPEYQLVLLIYLYEKSYTKQHFIIFRERVETDECEDIDDVEGSNYCDCIHDRPTVIIIFFYFIFQ